MSAGRTAFLLFVFVGVVVDLVAQGVVIPPPPSPATEEQMAIPENVVIVSGNGGIRLQPDTVSFNVTVETEAPDATTAVRKNSETVAAIITLLEQKGVSSQELKTQDYDVEKLDEGYRVRNELGITRNGTAGIGDLMAAAIDAGGTDVTGPQFSVADEKSVQDRCLGMAFEDATRKAQRLASLARRRLDKVLAVTDGSSSPFQFTHRAGVEGTMLGGMSIAPGMHIVDCGVTVAFALVD